MADPPQLRRSGTIALSAVIAAIGVALIVEALVTGPDVSVLRVVIGALFLAAGIGRIYVLRRTP